MRKRFYICDGKIPDCRKTCCAFLGLGDCMHTANKKHARYRPPREWDIVAAGSKTSLVERLRPNDR